MSDKPKKLMLVCVEIQVGPEKVVRSMYIWPDNCLLQEIQAVENALRKNTLGEHGVCIVIDSKSFDTWRCSSAVYVVALSVSVCLSVRHKLVYR